MVPVRLFIELVAHMVSKIQPVEKQRVGVVPSEPACGLTVHVEQHDAEWLLVQGGMEAKELLTLLEPLMRERAVEMREREFETLGRAIGLGELLKA